jgi:mono/diheme cytochrome c family protein
VGISISPPAVLARADGSELARFNLGRTVAARAGCLACHRIGAQGSRGPGPNLTHVGSMLPARIIERVLVKPEAPMPSFSDLPRARLGALVVFLSLLRCPGSSRGLLPQGC